MDKKFLLAGIVFLIIVLFGLFLLAGSGNRQSYSVSEIVQKQGIELVGTEKMGNYVVEYYQNYDYTCGFQGFQTFALMYRDGTGKQEPRPLWIRMPGESFGYFDEGGNYLPGTFFPEALEEKKEELVNSILKETGLLATVITHPSNFRILIPSNCDGDAYSGKGEIDLFNPYSPDEKGEERKVDGLLAVRSALNFVLENTSTTKTVVHGTGSGAIGGMSLIIDLGKENKKLNAAVLDSGVLSVFYPKMVEQGCTELKNSDGQALFDRIGEYGKSEFLPHNAIASQLVTTPIFLIWNKGDSFLCGEKEVSVVLNSEETFSGKGMELGFLPIVSNIESYNPGNASVSYEVCVNSINGSCDLQSPTRFASSETGGDQERNGQDYNEIIMKWIDERLKE
jgi:hypothetical protein